MLHKKYFHPLSLAFYTLLLFWTLILVPEHTVFAKTLYSQSSMQEEDTEVLENAKQALKNAIDTLKVSMEDASPHLTSEKQAVYTPKSYTELNEAFQTARAAAESADKLLAQLFSESPEENPSEEDSLQKKLEALQKEQTAVEQAGKTLKAAVNGLQIRADKTSLKKSITAANKLKASTYTPETFSAFTACLNQAKDVYADENAVQSDADKARIDLENSINALVEISREYAVIGNTYYYNVEAFGAYGNDGADDTKAIQEALDEASNDIHIVVLVPAGTYYINKTLYIQSNTTLQLEPGATIYRSDSSLKNNMLKVSDSSHISTGYSGYTLGHNITVTGGTWDGGNISKSKGECNLLYFGHCDTVTISNTTIRNCYGSHALEFAGVKNGTVRNCNFTGFRYGSDLYTSEAIQLDTCYSDWAPGFDADKTTCQNILIEKNVITDYPRGVGSHHVLKGHPYQNITIRNNTMKRSSSSTQGKCMVGIFLMGVKKASITNNTVSHYYYGIMIKQSSGLTVKKNKLKYNDSGNLIYEGNTAKDKRVRFTITEFKKGSKQLVYTCPTVKTGYLKTRGKTYRFKKVSKTHKVKLKQKLKKNQKLTFYGKDKYGNQYYRIYYVQ